VSDADEPAVSAVSELAATTAESGLERASNGCVEVAEALACGLVVPRVQPTLESAAQRFARGWERVPRPARLEFDHTDEIRSTVAVAVRVGDSLRYRPQPRTPSPMQPHAVVLPPGERRHNKPIDLQSAELEV
jgi:hypothetical protein